MITYINYKYKVAYALTDNVGRAGSVGLTFARDHLDLLAQGWGVYCIRTTQPMEREDRRRVVVNTVAELAYAIREGSKCTHSCPQHPKQEATG